MQKKKIVILDPEKDYVSRLCRFLERQEGNAFDVYGFSDADVLQKFLAEGRADILLVGEELKAEEPVSHLGEGSGVRIWLSDDSDSGEEDHVYRYQSAEKILRKALSCYEETLTDKRAERKLRAEIYGVYSPVKRCGKTTLSLLLGELLAEKGPALYLNLEDCSGLPALVEGAEEGNLSDLLYYHRIQQTGRINLYHVVRKLGKLWYVPPVLCPADIREAEPEELLQILAAITAREEYSFLVIDLGDALRDPLPLLRVCKHILMPVREDPVSRARADAFLEGLKSRGEEELLRRLRRLILPERLYGKSGEPEVRELKSGAWGQAVRQLLQENGKWNG